MKKTILIITFAFFIAGCATIINGTNQVLSATVEPNTAVIELLDGDILKARSVGYLNYSIKRQDAALKNYMLKISQEGYKSQIIGIGVRPSGWYLLGNFIFGGLIGWLIVDPITGSMWALRAKNGQDPGNIRVILLKDASKELFDKAVKVK